MTPSQGNPDHAGQPHHVELCVADLDASTDFWGWLLSERGYEPKRRWDGGRSWVNGPTYLVLKRAPQPETPFNRHAPGLILPAVTS